MVEAIAGSAACAQIAPWPYAADIPKPGPVELAPAGQDAFLEAGPRFDVARALTVVLT